MLWDVAGATGLLVRRGQAGINMLANASEAVAAIARGNGGRVTTSQGEGDGAVVLFASVRDAVATAIEVNERIAQRAWPDGELVAVRSAIHIGDVTVTAAGVFGSEVHRCARLRALADGGEVFLSDAAVATVGLQSLPDGSSAVDEGLVLVPGFAETEAEHVWRLVHPALQARQRALQLAVLSPPSPPVWRTSFVGRAEDVASVGARLDARRLVTLVGPAGVGKTRLAAAVAAAASGRACFVDLTLATKPDEVDALVADVVGSNRESAPRKGIEAALGAAPALLVLDNCEHVLDAVASLVEFVLTASGGSSVLATSRSALRVADEDLFVVAPLQTAVGGDATQLFIDRAGVALGALSTDVRVLDQIGAVTALLDGVPLAIELAAARVTAFSVGEILAMLQHDMAGLGDARRRGPDRQRSVRSAIGWSLRMLSHDERRLLGRLAMLPGSFRLGAAIAVAGRGEDRVLVEAMQAFVDQSLIAAQHRTGPTRYRMLEMIRSIAQDEIGATERDEVLDRLLAHCLDQVSDLAGPVAPEVGFEEEARLDAALFSTSIEHALATNQIESGLQLVYDLFTPWHTRTQRSTLDRWTSDLVAKTSAPSSLRAMVLRRQAILADEDEGDAERARQLLEAAAADASVLNNRALLGRIQSNLAFVIDPGPKDRRFEQLLCEAIKLLDECGDSYVSEPLTWLANLYARRGRFDQTEELLNRAEAVNPPWFVLIKIEMQRAMCALLAGRVELVGAPAARALEMAEQSGDPEWIAQAGGVAATGALARGEIALAEQLWIRLVALARENDLSTRIDSLGELAVVSALQGDLSVARSCRDELRSHLPGTQWTKIERALARLACSFVDLADGDADMAAEASAEVLADAERHNMPLIRALSLELIAASIASTDPQHARELLAEADQERIAIGAIAWPVQPYRDAALRTLEALAPNG
jgi:predicted ATPase